MFQRFDYLSNKTFLCLKGWFALCILVHHIQLFTKIGDGTYWMHILGNLGYWSVGMFIFMSGFGLYESYRTKGMSYINCFPRNRLLVYELYYLLFVGIYFVFDLIKGVPHSAIEYMQTLTYGSTIISFGWYLQLNLVLYIFFWLVFKFVKKHSFAQRA